jgi:hypothetical protein
MNVLKIINISGFSAPITGLVLFIWSVQSKVLNIDQPGRDIADEDARLIAGFLPYLTGQYKGRTL